MKAARKNKIAPKNINKVVARKLQEKLLLALESKFTKVQQRP
jgi:hypothetical protein